MPSAVRYAVYLVPTPESPWGRFGARWLGRCAATGEAVPQLSIAGLPPDDFRTLTDAPRKYGFHATLKAPFRLRAGLEREGLLDGVRSIAREWSPFTLPPLAPTRIGRFLALAPEHRDARANSLAAQCVQALDGFRAPLDAADRARRNVDALTPRQARYLEEWGYPYVLADFRLHFTLTGDLGALGAQRIAEIVAVAATETATLAPYGVDALTVFEQSAPEADFRMIARCPFGTD